MTKLIHNVETGEITTKDFTKDELAQNAANEAARVARIAKSEADANAKSALLDRLGISADEAALLIS
jgi:hypothetical protein